MREARRDDVCEPDVHRAHGEPDQHAPEQEQAAEDVRKCAGRGADCAPPGCLDVARDHPRAVSTFRAPAATACMKPTIRGPHRDAMSSLTATTPPFFTAAIVPQPGRARRLAALCLQ